MFVLGNISARGDTSARQSDEVDCKLDAVQAWSSTSSETDAGASGRTTGTEVAPPAARTTGSGRFGSAHLTAASGSTVA